jgi:thymidylate synthase
VRDSETHLDGVATPCLMYLTCSIRNARLDVGVHFDTNAIEYLQANFYGLTELQRIVADDLHLTTGTYHHFIDSLYVSQKHSAALKAMFSTEAKEC